MYTGIVTAGKLPFDIYHWWQSNKDRLKLHTRNKSLLLQTLVEQYLQLLGELKHHLMILQLTEAVGSASRTRQVREWAAWVAEAFRLMRVCGDVDFVVDGLVQQFRPEALEQVPCLPTL